jgi:hypothetical protein
MVSARNQMRKSFEKNNTQKFDVVFPRKREKILPGVSPVTDGINSE